MTSNSVAIKAKAPAGFELTLSLADEDTAELMKRTLAALAWLGEKQFTPTSGQAAPVATSANGNGETPPVCQFHGPMKRSQKFAGWYCPSKMGDGSYCKEQVKD